ALVIIARQIDLSVGAIVASSAFVSAAWLKSNPDGSMWHVFAIGAAVGLVMGFGNAALVVGARIPAIVVTLGTLAVYRGFVLVFAGGEQISATVLPDRYQAVAQTSFGGVPLLVWIAAVATVGFGWAARYTRTGRNLYALGSSPESARTTGINATWHLALVFLLSGLLCGFVGVLWGG